MGNFQSFLWYESKLGLINDVNRALRSFQTKDSIVGKLFAKHIKLEEAKQFLQRARSGIGAGTPTRISDLIESGEFALLLSIDSFTSLCIQMLIIDLQELSTWRSWSALSLTDHTLTRSNEESLT